MPMDCGADRVRWPRPVVPPEFQSSDRQCCGTGSTNSRAAGGCVPEGDTGNARVGWDGRGFDCDAGSRRRAAARRGVLADERGAAGKAGRAGPSGVAMRAGRALPGHHPFRITARSRSAARRPPPGTAGATGSEAAGPGPQASRPAQPVGKPSGLPMRAPASPSRACRGARSGAAAGRSRLHGPKRSARERPGSTSGVVTPRLARAPPGAPLGEAGAAALLG